MSAKLYQLSTFLASKNAFLILVFGFAVLRVIEGGVDGSRLFFFSIGLLLAMLMHDIITDLIETSIRDADLKFMPVGLFTANYAVFVFIQVHLVAGLLASAVFAVYAFLSVIVTSHYRALKRLESHPARLHVVFNKTVERFLGLKFKAEKVYFAGRLITSLPILYPSTTALAQAHTSQIAVNSEPLLHKYASTCRDCCPCIVKSENGVKPGLCKRIESDYTGGEYYLVLFTETKQFFKIVQSRLGVALRDMLELYCDREYSEVENIILTLEEL